MSTRRQSRYLALLMAAATVGLATASRWAEATIYKVDPEHTSVTFTVRHLLTKVKGRFDRFEGTITLDPAQPAQAKVEGNGARRARAWIPGVVRWDTRKAVALRIVHEDRTAYAASP